jgi:hypothetical protein
MATDLVVGLSLVGGLMANSGDRASTGSNLPSVSTVVDPLMSTGGILIFLVSPEVGTRIGSIFWGGISAPTGLSPVGLRAGGI